MSTPRPYPAGEAGQDPDGAATTGAEPGTGQGFTVGGGPMSPDLIDAEERRPLAGGRRSLTQVRRLRLVDTSGAVPRARDFVRQALHDWGWLPARTDDQRDAAEDVLLVVSELVTNACLHASGPEELRIGTGGKLIRLEVVDGGSGSPAPRNPHRPGRPGGHGMYIVQRLCMDWGVVPHTESVGKTVWAELTAPA